MVKTLVEQLRDAFLESGLTLRQLVDQSGVDIDPTGMGRKLNGKQTLRTHEYEAIARTLSVKTARTPDARPRRRKAA